MAFNDKSDVVSVLKEWVTPTLISVLGLFIWRDLTELRQDVKFLIKEQSIVMVKTNLLETRVSILESDLKNFTEILYRMPMYGIKQDDIQLPKKELSL